MPGATEHDRSDSGAGASRWRQGLTIGLVLAVAGALFTAVFSFFIPRWFGESNLSTGDRDSPVTHKESPNPSPATTTSSDPSPTLPLAEMDLIKERYRTVVESDDETYFESVDIDGESHAYAVYFGEAVPDPTKTNERTVDFDLARDWEQLTASVGVTDKSRPGVSQRIELIAVDTGRVLYSGQFVLGKSEKLHVDVSGVLRLRFRKVGPRGLSYPAMGSVFVRR